MSSPDSAPVPDTEARIVDLESDLRECATGEVGELMVKGPQIMQGYWGDKDLTSRSLKDGWFRTRDLARMDQDGAFYLVDRKDDLIISSGYNIGIRHDVDGRADNDYTYDQACGNHDNAKNLYAGAACPV